MNVVFYLIFITNLFDVAQAGPMGIFYSAEEARRELFAENIVVSRDSFSLSRKQEGELHILTKGVRIPPSIIFERVENNDSLIGYIFYASEIGKVDYMDFAIALSPKGKVLRVLLMVYRESIGGEVKSKRFMQQFNKKHFKSKLRLNRDIQGISGATLSSRAIIRGVKKAVTLWKVVYDTE